MRVLVVYAHPLSDSFAAALRDTVVQRLRAAGHDVDHCDLYAEGFALVADEPCLARPGARGSDRRPPAALRPRLPLDISGALQHRRRAPRPLRPLSGARGARPAPLHRAQLATLLL